jgi:putative transposase
MPYDPEKYHRHSIRLPDYDYCSAGAYFVTICACQNICLFGDIVDSQMHLSELGQIADGCWRAIPAHHRHVALDSFVVMPNHVHGILWITQAIGNPGEGARYISPLQKNHGEHKTPPHTQPIPSPSPGSLGVIIGTYKAAVTRAVNRLHWTVEGTVWQRSYYERVIRHQDALRRVRAYIVLNPARWMDDPYHPADQP